MFTAFLLHFTMGCKTVEAQETPLPEGATELRDAIRSFQSVRAWLEGPENAVEWGGQNPPFGTKFVASARHDGVVVIDTGGLNTRFRWTGESVTRDSSETIFLNPTDRPERHAPREQKHWRHTAPIVQSAVLALRDPETEWIARGPAYYGWAAYGTQDVEIVPAQFELGDYHIFVHFSRAGLPTHFIAQRARSDRLNLTVHRLEIDPPLPATWFEADAPDFVTRFPRFDSGEPSTPLDPGFYASTGQQPPPDGGQPLPPSPGQPPPGQPPPPP